MGGSGSDTETDDELFDRIQASRARKCETRDVRASERERGTSEGLVGPENETSENQRDGPPQQILHHKPSTARASEDAAIGEKGLDRNLQRDHATSGFPAFLLNSADDEQSLPARSSTPPSPADPDPAANTTMVFSDGDEPPRFDAVDEEAQPSGSQSSTPLPSSQRALAPSIVLVKADTQAVEQRNAAPAPQPPTSQALPTVVPDSGHFISPFSSLTTQYRPPPPPVVGAPPTSYVPGRAMTNPTQPPPASAVRIECFKCSKVLPPISSPVPVEGHSACSCCQRYYGHVVSRTDGSQYCTSCIPPPRVFQPSVPPSHPGASLQVGAILCAVCALCKEHVRVVPPKSRADRLVCQCCVLPLSVNAFTKNQRKPSHPMRRCRTCVTSKTQPAKFHNIHGKNHQGSAPPAPRQANVQASTAAPSTSLAESQVTAEELLEMEIAVRNYKLAKRSINRRRIANDLRGSTRIGYEAQLAAEEKRVDEQMAKARAVNPQLFDDLNRGINVKSASVPPLERDNAGVKKTTKRSPIQPKPARKTVAPQKRKPGESSATPRAKRTRASASPSPASLTKSVSVVPLEPDSPIAKRVIPTRSRTRGAAKPIEVIDLVDSD